jgi:hypothetical protein
MAKLPMPGKIPQRKQLAMGPRSPISVATPSPMAMKKGGKPCPMKKGGKVKKKK